MTEEIKLSQEAEDYIELYGKYIEGLKPLAQSGDLDAMQRHKQYFTSLDDSMKRTTLSQDLEKIREVG